MTTGLANAGMKLALLPKSGQPLFWGPARLSGLPSPYGRTARVGQQLPPPGARPERLTLIETPLLSFLISAAGAFAAFTLTGSYWREKKGVPALLLGLTTGGLAAKSLYDLSRMGVLPSVS